MRLLDVHRSAFRLIVGCICWLLLSAPWPGLADDSEPVLQLEGRGPLSYVTALAFSPDGQTLYAAGWDKVVRVWRLDEASGKFLLDERSAVRVPIGPGLNGAINSIALSSDGRWLAVGGRGTFRGASGFRDRGRVISSSAMSQEMRADQGTVYVYDLQTREALPIRGHWGEVFSLAFAPGSSDAPRLITAGRDWNDDEFTATLRVWDIRQQKYLAGKSLAVPQQRPQIAAWRAPGGALRVSVAWGDGQLRVWDVQSDRLYAADAGGNYNNTVVHYSDEYFLVGNADSGGGHLERWYYQPGAGVREDQRWRSALSRARASETLVPRSLALAASRPGGSVNHAAVVTLAVQDRQPTAYQLEWVELASGTIVTRLPLWPVDEQLRAPVLATSAQGRHLAVSGGGSKEILIYPIAELKPNVNPRPQRMQSIGETIRSVAFVEQEGGQGLLLSSGPERTAGLRDGDLLFDFQDGLEVFEADSQWRLAPPATSGWAVERDGRALLVRGSGPRSTVSRIELPADAELTAYAVSGVSTPPVVAVASYSAATGETMLVLHEANTGAPLRHYTAHTLPIRSLAFSGDGRLLASTAEDYLICVWSLTDLSEIVGNQGAPPELPLQTNDGLIVLSDDAPTFRLARGDVLMGITGHPHWTNEVQVFDAFWNALPGTSLSVDVRRGRETFVARLPVRQGVDERKPLFSLFLAEADGRHEAQWVAWSPLGPYDASSRAAERLIGWHFNTGDDTAPAVYAHAEQYRGTFYRKGLLPLLVENGALPAQLPPPPPIDRPLMKLSFPEQLDDDLAGDVELLVREPQELVQFESLGLNRDQVNRIKLLFYANGEGPGTSLGEFELQADQTWTAALPGDIWQRGQHTLEALVTTREETPQEFRQPLRIRFQPPAPTVEFPETETITETPRYTFRAQIRPAPTTEVEGRLLHLHNGEILGQWDTVAGQVEQEVVLRPGANTFGLMARNQNALPGHEMLETTTRQQKIVFDDSRVPPPVITKTRITPLDADQLPLPALEATPGAPVIVSVANVTIGGSIESPERVLRASAQLGAAQQAVVLGEVQDGRVQSYESTTPLTLLPGRNTIRLVAETASKQDILELEVLYQPPLPRPTIVAPRDGLNLLEGRAERSIALRADLALPTGSHAYQAEIRVNGQPVAQPSIAPSAAQAVSAHQAIQATVPLVGGENRIELVLFNEWGSEPQVASVVVNYRRPPKIVALNTSEPTDQPFVEVEATIESPTPLIRVEVNGRRLPADAVTAGAAGRWIVKASDVPLTEGANNIYLFAWNAEGVCLQPGTVKDLMFMHAPPPLASVSILDPSGDAKWSEPHYPVSFRVTSPNTLRSVQLLRNGKPVLQLGPTELARAEESGRYRLEHTEQVPLEPGANHLELIVINDGGERSASVQMSYIQPAMRVEIDHVSPVTEPQQKMEPLLATQALVRFGQPAPSSQVLLRGRVVWTKTDLESREDLLAKWSRVQVWVNGYLQSPQFLQDPADGSLERPFEVPIVLNRSEKNVVELRFPDLKADVSSQLQLVIDCAQPQTERRLHLLIVGIGDLDPQQLERAALEALRAVPQKTRDQRFQTAAFTRGYVYGPIVGPTVSRAMVFDGLRRLRSSIDRMQRERPGNDVVMVYYQGGELVEEDGQFYLTTIAPAEATPNRQFLESTSLDSGKLNDFFESTSGAHVWLLEVARFSDEMDRPAQPDWMDESRAAVLRYAWLNTNKIPSEAHLITALRSGLQGPKNLGTLDQFLSANWQSIAQRYAVLYESYLHPGLAEIALSE